MGFQDTFKALSDPTRRKILDILKAGGRTAGEIAGEFHMTNATMSHHLAVLRAAGLVDQDKRGKYIYYELNMTVLDELVGWVVSLKGESGHEIEEN